MLNFAYLIETNEKNFSYIFEFDFGAKNFLTGKDQFLANFSPFFIFYHQFRRNIFCISRLWKFITRPCFALDKILIEESVCVEFAIENQKKKYFQGFGYQSRNFKYMMTCQSKEMKSAVEMNAKKWWILHRNNGKNEKKA